MANLDLQLKEILLKYKFLDANIILERNELINNENLHNELCNIMGNIWQKQSLTQPIVCATLSGNEKICSMIDNKIEVLGESPYWLLSKAQLKVNEQRDKIDKLICELVRAIVKENDIKEDVKEDVKNVLDESPSFKLDTTEQSQCESDYLEMVEQKAQDEYETFLAIKSFIYGVIGALAVNIFVVYLNSKH